jgi:hypothetical protein
VKLVPIGAVRSFAGGIAGIFRRRRDVRAPRVRLRIDHGETRVLADGDPGRDRLLSLSRELVADYGGPGNARS